MVPGARRRAPSSPLPPPSEARPPTLPPAAPSKPQAPAASAKVEAPSEYVEAEAPAVTPRAALSSTLPTICSSTPTEWDDLIDESAVKVTHVSDEEDLNPTEAARYRSMLASNAQVLPSGLALMDTLPRNLSFRPPPCDAARSPVAATASSDDSSSNGRRQLPRGVPLRPVNRRRRQTVGSGAPVRGPPPRGAAGSATTSSVLAAARASGSGHTVRFAANGNNGATYAAALASVDGGSLCTLSDDDDAPPTPVALRSAGVPTSRRVGGDEDGVPLDGLVTPRPSLAVFASRRLAVRLLHGAVVREEGAGGAASGERRGGRFGRALRWLSLRA
ncbi:hypothetical protein BU14_0770s0001 [Porphyra umbilicalis]|uniref:Uncharacterized protein n=1 Tax=Porphyra umbilicalis TaxID=2786 RepID=A0A1X6NPV8_PORUM|nr:hypothetical protein BU14_0770s0001 [Porphyra umbilicalis]|eukprot:OSX70393.1 hypothetical protein BU14_0770s0001 [Porphyra umbilicalis]